MNEVIFYMNEMRSQQLDYMPASRAAAAHVPPVSPHLLAPPAELIPTAHAQSSAARHTPRIDEHGMRALWARFGLVCLSKCSGRWQPTSQVDPIRQLHAI